MEGGRFVDVEMKVVEDRMWGIGFDDSKSVMVENCAARVARNWNDEKKAKLVPTMANVVKNSEVKFCVRDGDKICVLVVAWATVCTKPNV